MRRTGLERSTGLGRMRLVSDKQRERWDVRADLRAKEIAAGRTDCVIKWEGVCNGRFEGWHHLLKLSAGGKDTLKNMRRSCNPCNGKIEDEPTEAERRGWVRRDSE